MSNYKPNLSEQQICFCDEYLVSFNAYRAAIAAGYSENTALKGELLHMPKIQEYLKLKMDQRAERLEISHDMILRELAKIAFSNMGNYYDERGDLRPMCELSERDKAAINQLELIDVVEADGYKVGKITKIKLHNKMSALDKIARHVGFYEKKSREPGVECLEPALVSSEVDNPTVLSADNGAVLAAAAVDEENIVNDELCFDGLEVTSEKYELMLEHVEESGGKILTFSPLLMIDGLNGNCIPRETLAVGVHK